MTVEGLLSLFAEGLEVEVESLTLETNIDDIDEWNSLGWLTIMSLVDERLNVQIGSKEIRGFKTVHDVVEYLGSKVALEK